MTFMPSEKTGKRRRALARAAALALPALMAALIAVSCGKKKTEEDAWRSFEILMNAALGQGAWTAASHSYDSSSDSLTATGLEIDLPKAASRLPHDYVNIPEGKAQIQKATVVGILEPARMEETVNATSWRGKPEAVIAGSFTLTGMKTPLGGRDGSSFEMSLDELALTDVKLRANSDPAPAEGEPDQSLQSSFELGSLSKKGFRIAGSFPRALIANAGDTDSPFESMASGGDEDNDNPLSAFAAQADEAAGGGNQAGAPSADDGTIADDAEAPMVDMELLLASFDAKGVSFLPAKVEALELPPAALLLIGQKAQSVGWKGLSLRINGHPQSGDLTIAADAFEVTGLDGIGKSEHIKLAGFKAGMTGTEPGRAMDLAVGSWEVNGLDLTPAFPTYLPGLSLAMAAGDPDLAVDGRSLAELFVNPVSYRDASLDGFTFDFQGVKLEDGRGRLAGPVTAWTLGDRSSELSGRITLGGEEGSSGQKAAEKFQDLFGVTSFGFNAATAIKAAPAQNGSWEFTLSSLGAEGLGDFSALINLSGITPETVEAMKSIPFSDPNPLDLLGAISGVGIERLNVSLKDTSLTNALVKSMAEDQDISPDRVREEMAEGLVALMREQFMAPAEAFAPLKAAVAGFMAAPTALTVDMSPAASVTVASAATFLTSGDTAGFMDFLNITVKNGDNPPAPLYDSKAVAALPPAAGDPDADEADFDVTEGVESDDPDWPYDGEDDTVNETDID
ncbi:MAG: hypothetical protein LBR80_10795 [Deltaproteobacteria bacterium]|jgi:hypothetical protein|nr:hypothetical protein [Deltaproteobacteria bacterium]